MPDYSKTPAEQREVVRQKFISNRESLHSAARAIFDRTILRMYLDEIVDEKTKTERRRQELLAIKAACLREMPPKVRERYEREFGPAARNGDYVPMADPAYQPELNAEMRRARQIKELRSKGQQLFATATNRGDLPNANRALQNLTRIQQLEGNATNVTEVPMQFEVLYSPSEPFPGNPGGRPLTDGERKSSKEYARLSPADRATMREGFDAAEAYRRLGGDLADLVAECYKREGGHCDR